MTGFTRRLLRHLSFAVTACALMLGASAHAQSGYTQPRYPSVLGHGLFGFDSALGVDHFFLAFRTPCDKAGRGSLWRRYLPPTAPRCAVSNCWHR